MTGRSEDAATASPEPQAHQPCYQPTTREMEVIREFHQRRQVNPPTPGLKFVQDGSGVRAMPAHPDEMVGWALIMRALGFDDINLAGLIVDQVAMLSKRNGEIDQVHVNSMMAIIRGLAPKDATEAVLATQMAAIHVATMTQARRLQGAETIHQQDSSSNALNKLARTFAAQVETLKRYRSGGQQKVTVEHVHVYEGGQAVVGVVEAGGGGTQKKSEQPHARAETMHISERTPVLGPLEALGVPMPDARGQGLVGVPDARRAGRPALRSVE